MRNKEEDVSGNNFLAFLREIKIEFFMLNGDTPLVNSKEEILK